MITTFWHTAMMPAFSHRGSEWESPLEVSWNWPNSCGLPQQLPQTRLSI